MKVAFLIEHLDARRGGMERSATEFVTELAGWGVIPHVLTQTVSPEFQLCPVTAFGVQGWNRAAKFRNFIKSADRLIRADRWDVVHSIPPCLHCDLYQPRSGLVAEALERTVALRRSSFSRYLRRMAAYLNSKHRLLHRLEDQLLSRPSPPTFAALSRYMRRQVQNTYGLADAQVRDVFNGVTVDLPTDEARTAQRKKIRSELNLSNDTLVALFVGHNFRRKGLSRLIEALACPSARPWQLLVAGKDHTLPYARQAERLGLKARVQFLGPRRDIHSLYMASDAGFLPTYYDPCARTVLEGLSLGLPYVTTAHDGAADCIENGRHGFVIDSADAVEALAETFQQLAARETREQMSHNALELRPYLSMRRHAQQIITIYEEIRRKRPL